MKRAVLFFLFSIITLGFCFCQQSKNDWEYDNLKGKVKSIRVIPYYFSMENKGERIKIEDFGCDCECGELDDAFFNLSNKNLIRTFMFLRDRCYNYMKYYDTCGNLVKYITFIQGSSYKHTAIVIKEDSSYLVLDKNNNVIQARQPNTYYPCLSYSYDKRNNIIEIKDSNIDITFEYDSNNNLVKANMSNSEGYNKVALYKYDKENRLIKFKSYNLKDNEDDIKASYRYDRQGRLIKKKYKCIEGSYTEKYTYKNNKRIQAILFNDSGNSYITEYDDNNNVIKGIDNQDIYSINKYDYDKYGNWIKQYVFNIDNKVPECIEIIERKIEYYE